MKPGILRRARLVFLAGSAVAGAIGPAYCADASAKVAKLAVEVQRLEDVRTVKKLQDSYSQYAQFGLWNQMAGLFSDSGTAIYGNDTLNGRQAIEKYYRDKWGSGHEGLAPGGIRAQFDDTPVVNLSADGKTAYGRWHELGMMGVLHGPDDMQGWAIGQMENVYVKENGVWRISQLHYYPFATGTYKDGWRTAGTVPYIPYHYTPDTAPIVAPPVAEAPPLTGSVQDAFAGLNRRITALNDEDAIRNLQNSFGYYKDRKMWDDCGDLFTADAVLEDSGAGIYTGKKGIRRWLERMGPAGLKRGELNEGPLFDMTVSISPDGGSARERGIEWRELGDNDTQMAELGLSVFENSYVKGGDGIWRIREMRIFPIALTDYYQGWNKSRIETPNPTGSSASDKPVPIADRMRDRAIPAFFQMHPVTGTPVALPQGATQVATEALLPVPTPAAAKPAAAVTDAAVADAERRLGRSYGYDAIDNVTHAFGNYIMDNRFKDEAALYDAQGWRGKQAVGFCQGPDHIEKCETTWPGGAPLPNPRTSWGGRWMLQPVIMVSGDGKSGRERTRLHSFRISDKVAGVLSGAVYPTNQFKLVNGVWKADVISIEEPYWSSSNYKDGWAKWSGTHADTHREPPAGAITPDVPRYEKLKIRFWGIDDHPNPAEVVYWPDIKPMWFDYVNPVSGRRPPNYCLDVKSCEATLEAEHHKPVQ